MVAHGNLAILAFRSSRDDAAVAFELKIIITLGRFKGHAVSIFEERVLRAHGGVTHTFIAFKGCPSGASGRFRSFAASSIEDGVAGALGGVACNTLVSVESHVVGTLGSFLVSTTFVGRSGPGETGRRAV